jgi:beta-N-acetylhexosaminidase
MWITDILRKRIGYRNLIVSDDLEMGGVLAAAPIGEAAVEFIRAGGDLCLVCHREDYILQAHEALVKTAAGDRKFARRAEESVWRVAAFKKKSAALLRLGKAPSEAKVETLSRQLWEFSERVRLEPLARASDRKEFDRKGNDRRVRVKDRKNKDRKEENRKVKDRRRP